jgi:hypothetical protein
MLDVATVMLNVKIITIFNGAKNHTTRAGQGQFARSKRQCKFLNSLLKVNSDR